MKTLINLLILAATLISFSACSDDQILEELQSQATLEETAVRPDGLVDGNKAQEVNQNPFFTNKPDGFQDGSTKEVGTPRNSNPAKPDGFQDGSTKEVDTPRTANPAKPDGEGRSDIAEIDTDNDALLRADGDTHPGQENKKPATPSKQ